MKVKFSHALWAFHIVLVVSIIAPFLFYEDLFDTLAMELISGEHSLEIFVGVAALLTLDVFIPVPSSAVSVSAGMLLGIPMSFLACFIGLTTGAYLGYFFGYYFRKMHFERWYADDEFRNLSMQLSRFGYLILLLCRGVPILAELSVMVAGFHRYSMARFSMVVLLSNLILAGIYSVIGQTVANVTSVYLLCAAFLSIPFLSYTLRVWWLRRGSVSGLGGNT